MITIEQAIKSGLLLSDLTPYSNIEPFECAKRFLSGVAILPHIGQVQVLENSVVNWSAQIDKNEKSTLLWLYSLVFVDYLTKASVFESDFSYLRHAIDTFKSFSTWLNSCRGNFERAFQDEHCVSNRALILMQFSHVLNLSLAEEGTSEIIKAVNQHIYECCNWLVNDENYVFNNHGIIMDRTLLNAYVFFKNSGVEESSSWKDKALKRLEVMIKKTFDADGCCTENSTSYHILNVSLFHAIKVFMERNQLSGLVDDYIERLQKASDAIAFQVYNNGELPLIGDSYSKPSVYLNEDLHKNKYGTAIYAESGFVFIKQPNFYFSFKCGGKTTSHRHVDDTSITLQYKGRHFICDGGMNSYDSQDPMRQILASYKSHSGVFTDDCSNFRFKNYKCPSEISKIENYQFSNEYTSVSGVSFLDSDSVIRREISWCSTPSFLILDTLESDKLKKWRVQYLLHPDVTYEIGDNWVKLFNDVSMITLDFITMNDFKITVEQGFYSESFLGVKPTNLIVVSGVSCNLNIKTFVKVHNG